MTARAVLTLAQRSAWRMCPSSSWRSMRALPARCKALAGAGTGLFRLDRAVACGGDSLQRPQQAARGLRNVRDGAVECRNVCLRRLVEAGELAHELERRGADFVLVRGRLEVE